MKFAAVIISTLGLMAMVFFFAAAGHGTYVPAKLIYPYAIIIGRLHSSLITLAVIIAVLQVPIYFLIIYLKPRWLMRVALIHAVAVIIAFAIGGFG